MNSSQCFVIPGMRLRRRPAKHFKLQHGVTLMELVVVIAVAAILALIAIPSMVSIIHDFRQKMALSLLVSDLGLARSEAIKRNTRMLVCVPNSAGTDCANSTTWSAGWVICIDANFDNECDDPTADNPNPVIVRPALDPSLTLTSSAAVIRFNANGTQGSGGAAVSLNLGGTWSGAASHTLTLSGTGNVSTQ
jgi:type IV fimbrial biogenesis protein FimT